MPPRVGCLPRGQFGRQPGEFPFRRAIRAPQQQGLCKIANGNRGHHLPFQKGFQHVVNGLQNLGIRREGAFDPE